MQTYIRRFGALCLIGVMAVSVRIGHAQVPQFPVTTPDEFNATLQYQTGAVTLPGGLVTINLSPQFRYLGPMHADRVLVQAWGNPPGTKTLGMIFPADTGPLDDNTWGVVITYEEDGYVSDEDASEIDYTALLKEMQAGVQEASAERVKQGYSAMTLIGWATPPHYDKNSHKLYWAKELAFGNNPEHTLNYAIRVLGRRGVLVMNAVSEMSRLPVIERDIQQVLAFVDFSPGNRYTDYVPGKDKLAEYGIGALIAGGIAAKVGLFKWLIGVILAGKKLIFVGIVALILFLRKLFGRHTEAPAPVE